MTSQAKCAIHFSTGSGTLPIRLTVGNGGKLISDYRLEFHPFPIPKGQAKGKIVPVRFAPEDIRAVEAAAKASKQTVSEWIRSTLNAAISK